MQNIYIGKLCSESLEIMSILARSPNDFEINTS